MRKTAQFVHAKFWNVYAQIVVFVVRSISDVIEFVHTQIQ